MQNDEPTKPPEQPDPPAQPISPVPTVGPTQSRKKVFMIVTAVVVIAAAVGFGWWLGHKPAKTSDATASTSTSATTSQATTSATAAQGLQLDTSKNYGNTYANGVLPVGDGKYTTSSPKQGYVYACSQYAQNLASTNGGAMTRGPWFSSDGTTYDINKKVHVAGSVRWTGQFSDTVSGSTRTIVSNDLPVADPTGIFPIQSSDPAYQYDRNPNTITTQNYTYSLPANPTYNATPNCESGSVGVMTTGVALFNALDAGGRDAGAWEVQDGCSGHPQEQGVYHYHTLGSCIKDISIHDVIGFALDGFPITGPQVSTNNVLTSSDLDECHGITSQITLDGKSVTMYHYVMTQDFPYSISCFRGTPITPPGQKSQQQANQQGQIPNQHPRP